MVSHSGRQLTWLVIFVKTEGPRKLITLCRESMPTSRRATTWRTYAPPKRSWKNLTVLRFVGRQLQSARFTTAYDE